MDLPEDIESTVRALGARIRVGYPAWLRPFLQKGVVAITLGRRVYVARSLAARDDFHAILRHELVHVRQVRRLGLLRFLWFYLEEYRALRRAGLPPNRAYAESVFEVEARRAEGEPE